MEFKSTNNLPFEIAQWHDDYMRFRVGTCHGAWRTDKEGQSYQVLAIGNESPGNGHLQDVFDWFERSCKREGYSLVILEVWNEKFKQHLIEKRGFTEIPNTLHVRRIF
jgi:hypothetical protein